MLDKFLKGILIGYVSDIKEDKKAVPAGNPGMDMM